MGGIERRQLIAGTARGELTPTVQPRGEGEQGWLLTGPSQAPKLCLHPISPSSKLVLCGENPKVF